MGANGIEMIKPSEFKFEDTWPQEMRDQYTKLEEEIDAALKEKGNCLIELDGTIHKSVIAVIEWRYEQAGWIVKRDARGGGAFSDPHDPYIKFRHPIESR